MILIYLEMCLCVGNIECDFFDQMTQLNIYKKKENIFASFIKMRLSVNVQGHFHVYKKKKNLIAIK
jgi:hypothetical protein